MQPCRASTITTTTTTTTTTADKFLPPEKTTPPCGSYTPKRGLSELPRRAWPCQTNIITMMMMMMMIRINIFFSFFFFSLFSFLFTGERGASLLHTCHILPPSEIDLGLCLAVFAGSGGKYLFHRIG